MDFYDIIDKYKFYITTFIFFIMFVYYKKNELYGFRNNNDRKDL